jgi:hypothetical protein
MITQNTLAQPPSVPLETSFRATPPPGRFTIDGNEALEKHLERTCWRVVAGILRIVPVKALQAVLLGGGYGRGEGGVLKTDSRDLPYNDLEFYVCIRGARWLNVQRYSRPLHSLAHELSSSAGVHVEFKVMSIETLRESPVSMFYHDLVMGHRCLWGDESLLDGCGHQRKASDIPMLEATRLLMNRCSGLLFARELLRHEPLTLEQADFIARNIAKAQLALGDVVLAVHGQYHSSCRVRHERLKRWSPTDDLPWLADVRKHHAEGVSFKLHPRECTTDCDALRVAHARISSLALRLWLWLESTRLHAVFDSAHEYALSPIDKYPDTRRWRNRLLNAWTFGPLTLLSPRSAHDPREKILHALALLLWEPAVISNSKLLACVQSDLATGATTFAGLVDAYESVWRRFN